MTNITLIHNK